MTPDQSQRLKNETAKPNFREAGKSGFFVVDCIKDTMIDDEDFDNLGRYIYLSRDLGFMTAPV